MFYVSVGGCGLQLIGNILKDLLVVWWGSYMWVLGFRDLGLRSTLDNAGDKSVRDSPLFPNPYGSFPK